jgi:hypothetical protein
VQKDIGISWLSKGYSNFRGIDLGDKAYFRKDAQRGQSKIQIVFDLFSMLNYRVICYYPILHSEANED